MKLVLRRLKCGMPQNECQVLETKFETIWKTSAEAESNLATSATPKGTHASL